MTPEHQKYLKLNKLLEDYAEVKEYLEELRLKIEQEFDNYPFEKFYGEAGKVTRRNGYYLQTYNHRDVRRMAIEFGIPTEVTDEILKVTPVPPCIVIELNKRKVRDV